MKGAYRNADLRGKQKILEVTLGPVVLVGQRSCRVEFPN